MLSDTLAFIKSGLGFTESKSEPANEKTKTTGSADNSGGQGKSSQTVPVTGSLAQARFEQWLLAKTIEAAYGARDYAVRIAPVVRTAAFRAAPRALAAQTFHEIPVVGQAIGIVGGTYFLYSVGKAIFHAGDGKSDTSAEEALSGASSGSSASGGDDQDPDNNRKDKNKDKNRSAEGEKPASDKVGKDMGRRLNAILVLTLAKTSMT